MFVCHRNQVKYKKEKAKSQYYVHAVNENQNRPKKLWQFLKEIGASSKGKTTPTSISLNIENKLCSDKQKVAEYFNDYFTSIASSLVAETSTMFRPIWGCSCYRFLSKLKCFT